MDPFVLNLVYVWYAALLGLAVLMVLNWNEFWFRRFDPLSVGVARIGLGVLLLLAYLAMYPTWLRNYSRDGAASVDEMGWHRWQMFGLSVPSEFHASVFYWAEPWVPLRLFWWLAVLAAAGFTVGYRTRLCTVVLFLLEASMAHSNRMFVNGENSVFIMLLFYGCFAPFGARLSVDHWLERRQREKEPVSVESDWPMIWPVRLMQINIALIYVFSLPHKLSFPVWTDGTAIYWSLMMSMWSRWPWPEVFYGAGGHLLSLAGTLGTVLVEGAFPLLVWFRPTRLYMLAVAGAMHVSLAFMLQNMAFFTLAMVAAFWIYVPAETTRQIGRRFARVFLGRAPAPDEETQPSGDDESAGGLGDTPKVEHAIQELAPRSAIAPRDAGT